MQGGIITALLVLSLYGSYHFDVFGFEVTSNDRASDIPPSVASSLGSSPQQSFSFAPATVTPTSAPSETATPEPTATPEAESTSVVAEEEPEDDTALLALAVEEESEETLELEEEAEPEPTATPEPEPTATPELPTPTAVPPTATVAVATGVQVTPRPGLQAVTPTPTAEPAPAALAAVAAAPAATTKAAPVPLPANGKVTPYWDGLAGNSLGCSGYAPYDSNDPTTAAVSYAVSDDVPCGTKIDLCSAKTCITVERKDTCPGCAANHIDLSRKAFDLLCGQVNDCAVTIRKK